MRSNIFQSILIEPPLVKKYRMLGDMLRVIKRCFIDHGTLSIEGGRLVKAPAQAHAHHQSVFSKSLILPNCSAHQALPIHKTKLALVRLHSAQGAYATTTHRGTATYRSVSAYSRKVSMPFAAGLLVRRSFFFTHFELYP